MNKINLFSGENKKLLILLGVIVLVAVVVFVIVRSGSGEISQGDSNEAAVTLEEQNTSGISGNVALTEVNGRVNVILTLQGSLTDASHPAHIHLGSCPTPGAIKYNLANAKNGASTTVLDVSMEDVKSNLPLAVNVHESDQKMQNYVSCGNLEFK